MSTRIANYLVRRFGGTPPENGGTPQSAVPALTDRGLRTISAYLEMGRLQGIRNAPIQDMVQSEGWQIIEAEIVGEIKKFWSSAIAKMSSPDPRLREEAIFESLIARIYNEGVLGRVNRRMLDTMLTKDMIESMDTMREEHESLRREQG